MKASSPPCSILDVHLSFLAVIGQRSDDGQQRDTTWRRWAPNFSLAVCPNRACPIFLKSIRTVSTLWQYIPCGCEHIVDNFDTLILRLLVGISSVGFFCYMLTYTAVGNPCASISCFPVTFVRARESRLFVLGGNQTKSLRHRHRFHPSLACLSKPTAALFSEHPPRLRRHPYPLPFRGHISPVSVQTVAAPYPD